LFVLALAVRLITAVLIPRPGYMDAAYYAAGAVHLARGGGLSEPFLWNYLDNPAGIPHPGFLYWMPLPSLLAAPFAALFSGSFFALQIPFILLSAFFPLVGYLVAWEAAERRHQAWLAGLLVLFSGFFFPYWTLPETFAPSALFGSLALWLAGRKMQDAGSEVGWLVSLFVGSLVGLAHLTRADGILLFPVVILALAVSPRLRNTQYASRITYHVSRRFIVHCSLFILGYLLVMGPWFLRNLDVAGAPLSPAGAKTLWLTTYDDLFCYGCALSPRSYLAWGWGNILRSKLWAAGVNLERFLAEDCLVFLLPFVFVGLYRLRRDLAITSSLVYLLLVYLLHSFAFTFPGPRGGFFHASAPALPFLFAAAAEGLDAAVGWVGRWRRWSVRQARVVFAVAMVVGAITLSAHVASGKLAGWRAADEAYREVGRWLDARAVPGGTMVMVGNPPAFWYHTYRPAVVVPNGDIKMLLAVADRYGVDYAVLDANRPQPLTGPYTGLELAATFAGGQVQLYRRVRSP
jgi:hypothetical protein